MNSNLTVTLGKHLIPPDLHKNAKSQDPRTLPRLRNKHPRPQLNRPTLPVQPALSSLLPRRRHPRLRGTSRQPLQLPSAGRRRSPTPSRLHRPRPQQPHSQLLRHIPAKPSLSSKPHLPLIPHHRPQLNRPTLPVQPALSSLFPRRRHPRL